MQTEGSLSENTKKHKSQSFSSCAPSAPAHGKSCSCREFPAVADFCQGALNSYQNAKESDICKFTLLKTWVPFPPVLAHELNTCFSISFLPLMTSIFTQTVGINLFLPAPFFPLSPSLLYWRIVELPRVDQDMRSNTNIKETGLGIFPFKSDYQVVQVCIGTKLCRSCNLVLKYWLSESFFEVCVCNVRSLWQRHFGKRYI